MLQRTQSVSGDPARRDDVFCMSKWLKDQLEDLSVETTCVDLGEQEGGTLKLPPVILGTVGKDPKKKTVLVYGHYDVQPVSIRRSLQVSWEISSGGDGDFGPARRLGHSSVHMNCWTLYNIVLLPHLLVCYSAHYSRSCLSGLQERRVGHRALHASR